MAAPHHAPEISVIVPLFNEEATVAELYRRLSAALGELDASCEIVFVNDGSRDSTARLLDALQADDQRVVVLHLSRNFGHQAAISAGIDHTRGAAVVVMDGDLQDPPEVLEQLVAAWRAGGEVVYAVRTRRKEGILKRLAYASFYRLWRTVSNLDVPLDSGDFCLLDRKVVNALKQLPERRRFVRGLRAFVGFRQVGIQYERAARCAGDSKYSWSALTRLALDGLVGFSGLPINLVLWLGLGVTGLAVCATLGIIVAACFWKAMPATWATMLLVVLYLGAVQLVGLGIVGEYVGRIFDEAKGRPTYIVREVKGSLLSAKKRRRRRREILPLRRRGGEHAPRPAA